MLLIAQMGPLRMFLALNLGLAWVMGRWTGSVRTRGLHCGLRARKSPRYPSLIILNGIVPAPVFYSFSSFYTVVLVLVARDSAHARSLDG